MSVGAPIALGFGLAMTLLVALGYLSYARRRRRLGEFLGGVGAARRLRRSDLFRIGAVRAGLLIVGAAGLALAAADIRIAALPDPPDLEEMDVVLAMDVSASMQATDVSPTRLALAREVARGILDLLPEARIGLVLFSGTAYSIAPPTLDHDAIHFFLDGLTPTIATAMDPGTRLSQGIEAAVSLLDRASISERSEEEARRRVVVVIGDGEAADGDEELAAAVEAAGDREIEVHTVGIGTTAGAAMFMPEGRYQLEATIVDEAGDPVISHLREATLQAVAEAGSGRYGLAGNDGVASSVVGALESGPVIEPDVPFWSRIDPEFGLAAAALILLLFESLMDLRLPKRFAARTERRVA